MIDEPNRGRIQQIVAQHGDLFQRAPGSSHNHQAWSGGYRGHITDVMNRIYHKVYFERSLGRMQYFPAEERYTLSDALLCGFCHDLEKPWKYYPDSWFLGSDLGPLESKHQRDDVRNKIFAYYGLQFEARHINALRYAEGTRDGEYSNKSRLMWPLAVIVHTADIESGRHDYAFPRDQNDPWGNQQRD